MTEEIEVYHQDMETFLKPEEYQAFLKAKQEAEEYLEKYRDYKIKKSVNEKGRDECQKRRDGDNSDYGRLTWDIERVKFMMQTMKPAPSKPNHSFNEHDRYVELVRKRKLKQLEEEQRKEAEEQAERQREEERKQSEQQAMLIAMRRKEMADSEWEEFEKTFNSTVEDLKHQLANPKSPKLALGCSSKVLKYRPELWGGIDLPSDDEVSAWAKQQILEKIPEVLRDFVTWYLTPEIIVVPQVEYQLLSIASLNWHFDIYLKAEVDLWLKESAPTKEFHGLKYVLAIKAQRIGSLFLGIDYWDSEEGFSTPIGLVTLLAEGKSEGLGIEILIHDASHTVYTVEGFDDYFVELQRDFIEFIKDVGSKGPLAQGLLAMGLVDEVTADLVEEKGKLPLPSVSGSETSGKKSADEGDLVSALGALGYKKEEIKKMVDATPLSPNMSLEEKVEAVLKFLDSNAL